MRCIPVTDRVIHSIPELYEKGFHLCLVNCDELLKKEGAPRLIDGYPLVFQVIELDAWEGERARKDKNNKNNTVDMVMLTDNRCFLFADAKFRLRSNDLGSKFIDNVKDKFEYSRSLFCVYVKVCNQCVLLVQSDKREQYKRRIRNFGVNRPDIDVLDLHGFCEKYIDS